MRRGLDPERDRPRRRSWMMLAAWLIVACAGRATACPVCVKLPEKTAADHLIEGEVVVLARTHPDDRFAYRAVEVIKGALPLPDIDLFVNSGVRRWLEARPDGVVVLVRGADDASWRSLGVADAAYVAVAREVLARSEEWTEADGPDRRCAYFAGLFGHENRAIFELAYLELGRAPYGTIKEVARTVTADDLRPMMRGLLYVEWRSLAILMLAQIGGDEERASIERSFASCRELSLTLNLAAYATAYVELHGERGVEVIEESYLRDSARTAEEVRAVVTALSVHGRDGHVHLRDRIARSYAVALRTHPEAIGPVARDLLDWEAWAYRDDVASALGEEDLDRLDAWSVRQYLRAANRR